MTSVRNSETVCKNLLTTGELVWRCMAHTRKGNQCKKNAATTLAYLPGWPCCNQHKGALVARDPCSAIDWYDVKCFWCNSRGCDKFVGGHGVHADCE